VQLILNITRGAWHLLCKLSVTVGCCHTQAPVCWSAGRLSVTREHFV
jgi:hypothetical protein